MVLRIGIIGMGVVGKATAYAFSEYGHQILSYDKNIQTIDGTSFADISRLSDIIFICTPEDVVHEVVSKLDHDNCRGVIVIRSTVVPGTTLTLEKQFGRMLVHNPEFLREKFAFKEALEPAIIVIGSLWPDYMKLLNQLYAPFARPMFNMSSTESEILKFWWNARLACNISFANDMKKICDSVGANVHMINNIVSQFSLYKWHPYFVGRFDGKCLPKDLEHLIGFAEANKIDVPMLKAILEVNQGL